MFVLRGSTSGRAHELTVNTRLIEWFTDRPARRAGAMSTRTLVRSWKAWGFDHDAPNAALSGRHLNVVVELSKPRLRGNHLHFDMAPVRGRLPHGNLGSVSTFVDATTAASTSTVQVVNNSGMPTTAYVFVTSPQNNELQSTAWLAQQVYPGEPAALKWDFSTQLMWGTGSPFPGTTFDSQQTLTMPPAGPGQSGTAELAAANGSYSLVNTPAGGAPYGSLAVQSSQSVPVNNLTLALGISGAPALLAPAFPNQTTTFPTTGLTYWLSTSPFIQAGQVVDTFSVSNAVQLNFPPGVGELTATLDLDGTWTIQPS